ncbi:helix-turn-helix transcriptional regulator [Saccharopolyspora taberi]|uniref:HTH cro/C1-type domain-containing protein n=1 Tax=Saccharopolyspora taberi TaxID=60895 RepID=A0ABN3V9Q2_9PSEU
MSSSVETPGPGRNVAILRKARAISQVGLAREAGVSVSLLSKIEVGERTLSHGVAAALARAMGITLDEVLGRARVRHDGESRLQELRAAIRRFDLPGEPPENPGEVLGQVGELFRLRAAADLSGVLEKLPRLLGAATNQAHQSAAPDSWSVVSDIYSSVYWIAARHRWTDLAELAVVKQRLAAERANPFTAAVASRDEAGTFLNSGDFEGGLTVVDRAIVRAESSMAGRQRALGLGVLHLRGMTLAGRMGDRAEAERHAAAAWKAAEGLPEDVDLGGITFGPENTATHVVATSVDLEKHRDALRVGEELARRPHHLPATRVAPHHLNLARAKLALRDRGGALDSLAAAWDAAPQMAKVHPTSQELIRVLISLHKRSNPTLTKVAQRAGLTL